MLKRIIIMLMVGLTISTAAVSCKGEQTKVKTEKEIAMDIANQYDNPSEINVDVHRQHGKVINFYASFKEEKEYKNFDGDIIKEKIVYVDQYDENGNFIERSVGEGYMDALYPFAVLPQ